MPKLNLNNRRLKYGSLATAISLLFIALIVIINVIAVVVTNRYPLNIDLTRDSTFKLSQTSVDYVKGIDRPVEIIVLTDKATLESAGSSALYFQQMVMLLDQYAQYSPNVSLEYVNIVQNPSFYASYPDLDLSDSDILVRCGNKVKKVNIFDLFNFDYNTGAVTGTKTEQMITSAIMGVVSDDHVIVDVLTGHNEKDLSAFTDLLEQNNYELITQNLVTEELNTEADILLVAAPMRDFDEAALKKLDVFLNNGKKYGKTLLYFADQEQPELPMLDAFLAEWGVKVGSGSVFETDASKVYTYGLSNFAAVEYADETYSEFMGTKQLTSVVPFPRPLEVLFDAKLGTTTSVLLQFSQSAGIKPADAGDDWKIDSSKLGTIPALVLSTLVEYDGMTPMRSYVAVCGSTYAVDDVILSNSSFNNGNYLINMLNLLTEREDVVAIESKDLTTVSMGLNTTQMIVIGVLFAVVLPLATIIMAIVIWLRRRHK